MGGPEFFGVVKAGTSFFSVCQRGGPKFFEGQRGGGTKIFSQIFFVPLPQFLLKYIIKKIRCLCEGNVLLPWGGTSIFSRGKRRGEQIFFP